MSDKLPSFGKKFNENRSFLQTTISYRLIKSNIDATRAKNFGGPNAKTLLCSDYIFTLDVDILPIFEESTRVFGRA